MHVAERELCEVPGFVSSAACPGAPKRRRRTRGAAILPGAAERPCTAPVPCLYSSSTCGMGSQPGAADRSSCRYDLRRSAAECSQARPCLRRTTATKARTLPGRTPSPPGGGPRAKTNGASETEHLQCTSLVGEEPSHLWPAFPSDPLGFSQIPGHCATQCHVVVTADMVALTQNKIWVSLTSRRPHTSSTRTRRKRPKISKKTLAEHCSTQSSTGREWMPQGAVNGGPWRR